MSDAGDPSQKMKVIDRRRFTDEGEVRTDWRPSERPQATTPSEPPPPQAERRTVSSRTEASPSGGTVETPGPGPDSEVPGGSTPFLELVSDLAQQAALFLNGAPGLPANPAQSQRLIDYLGVLESKTHGNLSAEEAQILSNVIFQLRTMFVQRRR